MISHRIIVVPLMQNACGAISKFILSTLRLVLFLPLAPGAFDFGIVGCVAAIIVSSAVAMIVGFLAPGSFLYFNAAGINAIIATWAITGVLLALLKTRHNRVNLTELLTAIAAAGIWFAILDALWAMWMPSASATDASHASFGNPVFWVATAALFVWPLATLVWAGRKLSISTTTRFGLRTLIACALPMFILPQQHLFERAETFPIANWNIWPTISEWIDARLVQPVENEPPRPRVNFEAIFDKQPRMVDESLSRLTMEKTGKSQIYFVGLAGNASQDVFMKEVTAARRLFDDRFGTAGHSLTLTNNRQTVDAQPIATGTNLKKILNGLGRRMNRDNDLLVLFLTSHGSEGSFDLSFDRAPINDLEPDDLAMMLDASGIKNQVIIISACHSGSFVPRLKKENRLVLTAARTDRASFGCSNERDWTYFGDAMFNNALRETHDFRQAFTMAKGLISRWETRDGLSPPSEPQMSSGSVIDASLSAVAADLDHRGNDPKSAAIESPAIER